MADASTLKGKSVTIGYYKYTFADTTSGSNVGVTPGMSVQEAITALCNKYNSYSGNPNRQLDPTECTVNEMAKSVTFTFKPVLLEQGIANVEGETITYPVPGANGEATNNITISCADSATLGQIDGSGVTNNSPTYDTNAKVGPFKIMSGAVDSATLTQAQVDNLIQNTLSVGGYGFGFVAGSTSDTTIGVSTSMTVGELRQAIVDSINTKADLTASLDASGNMTVTKNGLASNSQSYVSISEELASGNNVYNTGDSITGLAVSSQKTGTASMENTDKYEVTLPATVVLPFAININGSIYTYYDSTSYPAPGYTNYTTGGSGRPMTDTSQEAIYTQIANDIQSRVGHSTAKVTLTGTKININGSIMNNSFGFSIATATDTIKSYKYVPGSSSQLGFGFKYFSQDYSIPVDLKQGMGGSAAAFDVTKLYGKGFNFNGKWYEFNDTGSTLSYPSATRVDISGCTDFEAITNQLQAKMDASVTLSVDATGKMKISAQRSTTSSSPGFVDGYQGEDGMFTNPGDATLSGSTSGGTNATQPQTNIDFSSFSQENLNDLLGKGFRIGCATCKGEFINVMFCYDKANSNFPDSFEMEDTTQSPPVIRTIRNYVVELKDMTDGASIVSNIVDQIKPNLDHYTDVAVGNPNTTLTVLDKRAGDIIQGGTLYQAQISSGVYTNSEYHVDIEEILPLPELAGDGTNGTSVSYQRVSIYVGSDPKPQFIPIHLPFLTLENLNLDPPGVNLTDTKHSNDTLDLIQNAAQTISICRGTLGSDQNRLEYAANNTTNTAEQVSSAHSYIRDTDMAKAMMEQVKTSILQQTQQAMLSQANQSPSQVLSLLK